MTAYEFKSLTYTGVTGGHLKSCLLIPNKHVRIIDDAIFVHMSSVPHFAQTLWGEQPKKGDRTKRPLENTDIAMQLFNLRNIAFSKYRDTLKTKRVAIYGQPQLACPRQNWKSKVDSFPPFMIIDAPSIGGVEGCVIKTICPDIRGLNTPLFIECTDETIKYVRGVCQYQIANGCIKRQRHPRKAKNANRTRRTSDGESVHECTRIKDLEPHVVQSASGASDDDDAGIGSSSPAASCASSAHADIEDTSAPMSVEPPPKRQSVRTGAITDFFRARGNPIQG